MCLQISAKILIIISMCFKALLELQIALLINHISNQCSAFNIHSVCFKALLGLQIALLINHLFNSADVIARFNIAGLNPH